MESKSPQSRLMISKMVLENFKSYAGSQEIGPFHKCFSSIVGPNGSGKSNVIDALLFVFGKRAKQLRLNKVSELIHKSSRFPNLDFAKVSVYFQLIIDNDTPDTYEIISGSELVISRTAYLNNSSKYAVNDRASTYTDVGVLLRSHGIDLDNNRFLILQGEVEQIAMMKPKAATPHEEGLLEYLEDIIGSNRFVSQIEQAGKELDALNEQRTERVNRLKVAERERDNLSGSKAEAEGFMAKEKDIRHRKNELYQILEAAEAVQLADHRAKLDLNSDKLAAARSKLKDQEKGFLTMERTFESTQHDYNALDQELQKSTADFGAFERRDVKMQEDMSHLRANIKRMQANASKEAKREAECLKEAESAREAAEASRRSVDEVRLKKEAEEAALQGIMDGLRDATQELRDKLEACQVDLAAAERGVAGLSTEKETVALAHRLIEDRLAAARVRVQQAKEKLQGVVGERQRLEANLTNLGTERGQLEKQETSALTAIERASQLEATLQDRLRESIAAAEVAREKLTSQQSAGSHTGVVAAILKAAEHGGPLAGAGVIGRLGDLATISPEYDIAVSTACGSLDYILCETVEGAQKCVSYLRETKSGRGSFISLAEMEQYRNKMQPTSSFKCPSGARRLLDLISPLEQRFILAFYFVLKDTLVTDDLEYATKIAYAGERTVYRVVTRDGELIEISGAMSGGGRESKSGKMALTGSTSSRRGASLGNRDEEMTSAQLAKLDETVEHLQRELASTRGARAEADAQLQSVQRRLKALTQEFSRAEMSLRHLEEQSCDLEDRMKQLENDAQMTPAERTEQQSLQARQADIDREIEDRSPQLGSLRLAVAALQRKILDVGGPKLSRAQAKVDILAKQFEAASAQLSTKEVDEANARKQASKAALARLKSEEDCTKAQEKLAALLKEQEEMEVDAAQVNEAMESARARMMEQEAVLAKISAEFAGLRTAIEQIRAAEVDLAEDVKQTTRAVKECALRLEVHRKNLDALRKAHVEEQKEFNAAVGEILRTKKPMVGTGNTCDVGDAVTKAIVAVEDDERAELTVEALPVLDQAELTSVVRDTRRREELAGRINLLEEERDRMRGSVNMNALMDYLRKDASYRGRLNELELITEERNDRRRAFEKLRRQRLEEFMAGFGVITLKLKEMYQMITLGGDAELELVDSLDPFSEGIVFSVRPPKKSWKNISNLSGGEKTLSSLALVFALHHYKPTPLYVMDEIDAALDFKNVSIVANYIKERTKNAQFVIISLRNNMFELADRLVGIYKTNDATKSVTIDPRLFADMPVALVSSSAAEKGGSSRGHGHTQPVTEEGHSEGDDEEDPSGGDSESGPGSALTLQGKESSEPPLKVGRRHVLADSTNTATVF